MTAAGHADRVRYFRRKGFRSADAEKIATAERRMRDRIAALVGRKVADAAWLVFDPEAACPFKMAIADGDLSDDQRLTLSQAPTLISKPRSYATS